jgi:hypothetical protein
MIYIFSTLITLEVILGVLGAFVVVHLGGYWLEVPEDVHTAA